MAAVRRQEGVIAADFREQLQAALGSAYQIDRELGGGMARVFLAEETALRRHVVVKVLPPETAAGVSIERFKREIAIAAGLQHPHIVPLLSAGEAAGLAYFTMPYVEGESLRARISSEGELPVADGVRILREIATALDYAHARGVVHRDIKPDNVLLSGGSAMVTDFGVAKAISLSTATDSAEITGLGVTLGTPAYMAPEQAAAAPNIDARADIYAFGVLAYELFAGRPPFAGRSSQATLTAQLTEAPEPVERLRPSLPAPLASLIMGCLEKHAADRPQHAADIVRALDAIGPRSATSSSAGAVPIVKGRNRTRGLLIAAAALLVTVVASAVVLAKLRRVQADPFDSIAVLPLESAAGDTAVEWLSEGLTDGLSAELTRQGLRVPARTSVGAVHAKTSDTREIARRLGVKRVMSWKVSRLGSRLRLSAELDAPDGFAVWRKTVERDASDPLGVQDELLRELLSALREGLAVPAANAPVSRAVPEPEVQELYLRGMHAKARGDRAGLDRSIEYFRRAIARDSSFARAYAGIARSLMTIADAYEPPTKVVPAAMDAARRALALDSSLPDAHAILGALTLQYYWRMTEALRELDRAVALNPSYADAYFYRAMGRAAVGERRGAVADIQMALRLDPVSPFTNHFAVLILVSAGEPDSAIVQYHRALEVDSTVFYGEAWVGYAYRQKGRLTDALRVERQASALLGRPTSGLAATHAMLGQRDSAVANLRRIEQRRAAGEYIMPENIAEAWLLIGETRRALELLEEGARGQSAATLMVTWDTTFRRLLGNPRFERYLERVHLKPYVR